MPLIFFDYDGVQADSLAVESKYFVAACQKVGIRGIDCPDDLARLSEGNFYEECAKGGISKADIDKALELYGQKLDDLEYHIEPFPLIMRLEAEVADRFPTYIITSNTSATVAEMLERQQVTGVREILGADVEVSKVKKIDRVRVQYPGEKMYFIGDTKGDILEARAAGVDVTIGVTWGWHAPEVVASAQPDYIFHDQPAFCAFMRGLMDGAGKSPSTR